MIIEKINNIMCKAETFTVKKNEGVLSNYEMNSQEPLMIRKSSSLLDYKRKSLNSGELFDNTELASRRQIEESKQFCVKKDNDSSAYRDGSISYRNFNRYFSEMVLKRTVHPTHSSKEKLCETYFQNLNLNLEYIASSANYEGNYHNYVSKTLKSLIPLRKLNFSDILQEKKLKLVDQQNNLRKILILDLDETLIHADFELKYSDHDHLVSFVFQGEAVSVPIIFRPGVNQFLKNISEIFDVYVFTASKREYADAILDYLDCKGELFKRRFYREDCINIMNRFFIKDLRLFENCRLEDVVIVDNSLYSFANQLSNGCLISSFYNDREDRELFTLFNYLKKYVCQSDDVRSVNEKIFNFNFILEEFINNPLCKDDDI